MEGGRFLLAVVLMIAVVIVTNVIFPPVPPPTDGLPADSIPAQVAPPQAPPQDPQVPPPQAVAPQDTAPRIDTAGALAPADTLLVTSPLYRFGISSRGGALVVAELTEYESLTQPGQPVGLVPPGSGGLIRHRLRIGDDVLDLATLPFTAEPATGLNTTAGAGADSLRLVHADSARGLRIELTYRFDPDEYLFGVRARVTLATTDVVPQLLIDMGPTLPFHEWNEREETSALAWVVNNPQTGIESQTLSRVEQQDIQNGPLLWAALKNKYFLAAAIQAETEPMPFGGLIIQPAPGENTASLTATLLPNALGAFEYRLYIGPQVYDRLAEVGLQLTDANPYGWRFLRPIIRPLAHGITWLLLEMHRVLNLGYGWVLILFGILVRVLLWPLNARAMRSQMKSMELQPRLKELQTKYKADPERLQKEMLRIYKEEGFNPLGGCLPLLIPFPVLITLFFVFQATIEFRGVEFLWLPDLSRPDPIYIIPVLMGVSMFVLQWLSMRSTPDPNPQMKMMMWFMPIFMTVLFVNFASGLNLYYTAMNIASIPQQLLITRERKRWHETKGMKPSKATG